MKFEFTTPTLARLCSTTELRPLKKTYIKAIPQRGNALVEGALYDPEQSQDQALFKKKSAQIKKKNQLKLTEIAKGQLKVCFQGRLSSPVELWWLFKQGRPR